MKLKNVVQDNNGVSPVIGIILILSIVTVSIAIIYTSGVPFIDSAKQNTQFTSARNSFTVLHNDILEVANGPVSGAGTGRITKINLGSGAISVEPNETKMIIDYTMGTDNFNKTAIPGTIIYENKGGKVIYENGAVFSNYISSSYIEVEPKIYATNLGPNSIGLMIHIINLTGSNTSVGSTNTGKIRTQLTTNVLGNSYYVDDVTITITSQNNDSWARYFNETLTSANLQNDQFNITNVPDNTVEIKIDGSGSSEDIYLSIYETMIKSNAE